MNYRFAVQLPVLSFCIAGASGQGEVDARTTVAKGASAWVVHESVLDATVQFGGQEVAANEKVAWTLHLHVTDVDAAGNCSVTTRVVRVRGKLVLAMGQGEAVFDSAAEDDATAPPGARHAAKYITAVAGKTFRCKVGPGGHVLELGEGKNDLLDDGSRGGAMHVREEELLRRWVEGAFGIVPERRTAGGAKWNRTVSETFGRLPTRQELATTLTIVDLDFFEIESTGTVDIDREAAVALEKKAGGHSIGRIESATVTRGKVDSKQRTSRRDGFVLAANRTIDLEFGMDDPQMGAMEAKYRMTVSSTRTTETEALAKPAEGKSGAKQPADGKAK